MLPVVLTGGEGGGQGPGSCDSSQTLTINVGQLR